MKYSSLLGVAACLFALAGPVHSQTKTDRADVAWGEPRDLKEHGEFNAIVHRTDDHVYVQVTRKKSSWIQMFDQSLRMIAEREIPMEIGKEEHDAEAMIFQEDRMLIFSRFHDKKEDKSSLFVREYDLSSLAPKGTMKKLHSVISEGRKSVGGYDVKERPGGAGFEVRAWEVREGVDDDRHKLLLFSNDLVLESEEDEKDYDSPFEKGEFAIEDAVITDDGSMIQVGRRYPEKQEKRERKREGKPQFDMVLVTYPPGRGRPLVTEIPAGERFLQDMKLRLIDDDGDILCGGFWGNKGSWSVRGAYFMRIDGDTKEIVHQSFKEFDNDFITQYMTEKEEKKATKKAERKGEDMEMYEFDLDEIILREDGGAVLVGEQYYMYVTTTTTSTPNGGTTTTTTYHYLYNDIIAVNIDPAGDIEWCAKIPKRQHTRNDGGRYSSYALTVKGDKMYFIFNDTGENLMLLPGDRVRQFELKGKEALITLVTVDADGHTHREALLAPEKRDAILMPKECVQMEDDRMFIYAQRKKEYRYGMITFQ